MTRFKVTCRCRQCGTEFSRVLRSVDAPDPKCPKRSCRLVQQQIGMDMAKSPPAVGGSLTVKAVDMTAGIVMADHQLSDLKDNLRAGDAMVPRLPPALERQVDGFWGGGGGMQRRRGAFSPQTLAKRAMAGAFATADTPNPLAASHAARERPLVHTVASDSKR